VDGMGYPFFRLQMLKICGAWESTTLGSVRGSSKNGVRSEVSARDMGMAASRSSDALVKHRKKGCNLHWVLVVKNARLMDFAKVYITVLRVLQHNTKKRTSFIVRLNVYIYIPVYYTKYIIYYIILYIIQK
jgi:hypothetical protein